VLAQRCPASEILVADDGSTDTTAQVAMGYGHPVRGILQLPHTGLPGATRNAGIRAADPRFARSFGLRRPSPP
jgi:glycosyltransferase involved in cell wall biosynthesis